MNRIFYPIMLMAYGFFVLGLFARADAHEMEQERNLMRDIPRVHLAHVSDTNSENTNTIKTTDTESGTQRATASETSSVEGQTETSQSQ